MLNDLIEKHSKLLTSFCKKLCSNNDDAQDLFQETWIRVINGFSKYKKDLPFENWLLSICANSYKNLIRAKKSRPKSMSINDETDLINNLPDVNQEDFMRKIELKQLIDELKPKHKL